MQVVGRARLPAGVAEDKQKHKNPTRPTKSEQRELLVGRGGLEPPTSRLSGVRSNHLSYRPSVCALQAVCCAKQCHVYTGLVIYKGLIRLNALGTFCCAKYPAAFCLASCLLRKQLVEPRRIELLTS